VRFIDVEARPADSPALADDSVEDERAGIGENFCQPPLRAAAEPPELPGLPADPEFELPRASEPVSELFSEICPERWKPPFELAFPGRATLFPADLPFDAVAVPRVEKKC